MNTGGRGCERILTLLFVVVFASVVPCLAAGPGEAGSSTVPMVISGHPDYPPFMWKQGDTIVGVGAELVRTVCAELDIQCEIRYQGPWKRVQKNARHGSVDLISGIYINDERREYLDYTIPYINDPIAIVVAKGEEFVFQRREHLVGQVGITLRGDSFGQELDDYIKTRLNVQRAHTAQALFKNLMAGRVEYILWGYYPVMINADKLGFKDKIQVLDNFVLVEEVHMAFSKKSQYVRYLKQVNEIIERLKMDGTIEKWTEEYLSLYTTEIGLLETMNRGE